MFFYSNRDSSKNEMEIYKKEKQETMLEPSTTVTFVEGVGGLEKSKSDSKLNQVSCAVNRMPCCVLCLR